MTTEPRNADNFVGKVALVTGGTSGIGRTVAAALAHAGARVVITGRDDAAGTAVVEELRGAAGSATFIRADMTAEDDVRAAIDAVVVTHGRLDLAVNNAGVGQGGPTTGIDYDEYRRVFDINVWGVLAALKHELPAMVAAGGGAIVNTSSTFGLVGSAGAQIYSASKHAVEGITKSVALEFAGQGIRVNAVAPSMTVTPMFESFGADEPTRAAMAAMHPVGRLGEPADVARAVMFLLAPANSFITGTTLAVDGGWLAQ